MIRIRLQDLCQYTSISTMDINVSVRGFKSTYNWTGELSRMNPTPTNSHPMTTGIGPVLPSTVNKIKWY